jgi:hypothetical protein
MLKKLKNTPGENMDKNIHQKPIIPTELLKNTSVEIMEITSTDAYKRFLQNKNKNNDKNNK